MKTFKEAVRLVAKYLAADGLELGNEDTHKYLHAAADTWGVEYIHAQTDAICRIYGVYVTVVRDKLDEELRVICESKEKLGSKAQNLCEDLSLHVQDILEEVRSQVSMLELLDEACDSVTLTDRDCIDANDIKRVTDYLIATQDIDGMGEAAQSMLTKLEQVQGQLESHS